MVNRRPAVLRYSRFLAFAASLMLLAHALLLHYNPVNNNCSEQAFFAETLRALVSTICDVIQPFLILRLLVDDSMFWQGLVDVSNGSGSSVVNQPLVGLWERFGRNTIHEVVETIEVLEKEIVPIIPFGMISMDADTFVAGGAARVYRGRVKNQEVAIKILFCIDLTPERVIDFCKESTLLYSLRSPNIVQCLGVAIMPPALCLVTEYCLYGSLFDFLHTKRNVEFIRFIGSKFQEISQVTVEGKITLTIGNTDEAKGTSRSKGIVRKNESANRSERSKTKRKVSNTDILASLLQSDRNDYEDTSNYSNDHSTKSRASNLIASSYPPMDQSFKSGSFMSMSGSIDPNGVNRRKSLESVKLDIENSYKKEEREFEYQNVEKMRSALGVFKSRRFRFGYGPKGVKKLQNITHRRKSLAGSLHDRDSIGELLLQKTDPGNNLSVADTEKRVSVFTRKLNLEDSMSMDSSSAERESNTSSMAKSDKSIRHSDNKQYFLGDTLPSMLKLRMARDCCAGNIYL